VNKIFIIEGADGTGKTTLANEIYKVTKGHILHSTYNKEFNIEKYHEQIIDSAISLAKYQPVIIDRWAVSELVYGNVFRDGPSYDINKLIQAASHLQIVWIYCENEDSIENHKRNQKTREEMFNDMTGVVHEYDRYISTSDLGWIRYNFNWVDTKEFVKEII
jgi:thymidylate kinase